MTLAARFPPPVSKEIRGLAGPWLTCLAAILIADASGDLAFRDLAVMVYFFGCAALGALSIGQEYSHRTLALLLSQPARRERLFLVKMGVLAAMLATLTAVAVAVVDFREPEPVRLALALEPMLCGLFIAPWLTMLTRSPLAGTVFAYVPVGWMWILSERLYVAVYGHEPATAVTMAIVWTETLGLCAVGAVMSWRTFMRLEAIEGSGPHVHLPRWLQARTSTRAAGLTRRHPVWQMVKKEVGLQQMTLAVAGLYLFGWVTTLVLRPYLVHAGEVFSVISVFYYALLPVLIGSLASAEERHLGTLEWQVLLPVATRRQWAVKVATSLSLVALLALLLPSLLVAAVNPGADVARLLRLRMVVGAAAGATSLAIVSLYMSSVSSGGLQAMLSSVAAIFTVMAPVSVVAAWLAPRPFVWVAQRETALAWRRAGYAPADLGWLLGALELLLVVAILAGVLRFALANHRSADPGGGRPWVQAAAVTIGLTTGAMLLAALSMLS